MMNLKEGEWIGVDLDRTLAEYHSGDYHKYGHLYIGSPIPKMVERVKGWLNEGIDVRIFTARVNDLYKFIGHIDPTDIAGTGSEDMFHQFLDNDPNNDWWGQEIKDDIDIRAQIHAWCFTHIGQFLPITNTKDYHMAMLIDDKARQAIPNTGDVNGWEGKAIMDLENLPRLKPHVYIDEDRCI